MDGLHLRANAKINLSLDILGRRPDGYHEMDMVMQTITLCDEITLCRTPSGISLTGDDPTLPCDERNIAHRAARAFFERTGRPGGCAIHIQKRIPAQAGLGGGSSDGAAVLRGLNALYGAGLTTPQLCEVGAEVGADIPFLVLGGTARVGGFGEKLTPLPPLGDCFLLLSKPEEGVSTGAAFAAFDGAEDPPRPDTQRLLAALSAGDLPALGQALKNAMQLPGVVPPAVWEIARRMEEGGTLGACMSGSGSAVFGLFDREGPARRAEAALREVYPQTALCRPTPFGVTDRRGQPI